jgi:hypothetical protein
MLADISLIFSHLFLIAIDNSLDSWILSAIRDIILLVRGSGTIICLLVRLKVVDFIIVIELF